ncbi:MAG: F0F1 ATP synthase subunit delta [Chloroflexota bacterium]|nr:MAG: F0F1 ATP synthase subunit delta [Chloroflexota bacterium]
MATAGARRYARAVFELARETGEIDAWAARLVAVRELFAHPEVSAVLANPSIAENRRLAAVAGMGSAELDRAGLNLAALLVESGRIGDMDGLELEFQRLADEAAGRIRATATTAVALDPADVDRLIADLSARLGREVTLEVRVDPSIIGGLVLQVGDRVMDASVATRLQQLRRRLTTA